MTACGASSASRPNGALPQPVKPWRPGGVSESGSGRSETVALCAPLCDRPVAVGGLLACARPEPFMTLPRSVADVVSRHVAFQIESIDPMYLNLYVPQLPRVEGGLGLIHGHLGKPIAP